MGNKRGQLKRDDLFINNLSVRGHVRRDADRDYLRKEHIDKLSIHDYDLQIKYADDQFIRNKLVAVKELMEGASLGYVVKYCGVDIQVIVKWVNQALEKGPAGLIYKHDWYNRKWRRRA